MLLARRLFMSVFLSTGILLGWLIFSDTHFAFAQAPLDGSSKSVEPDDDVQPGDMLSYTLVLSNSYGTELITATLLDMFPEHTSYVPDSMAMSGTTQEPVLVEDSRGMMWNGTISANSNITFTYNLQVDERFSSFETTTLLTNTAVITPELDPAVQYLTSVTRVVLTPPSLTADITTNPLMAHAGHPIDYTIVVTNSGQQQAELNIRSPLAENVTFDTILSGDATFDVASSMVVLTETLKKNTSVRFRYRVLVDSDIQPYTPVTGTLLIESPHIDDDIEKTKIIWADCGPLAGVMDRFNQRRVGQSPFVGHPKIPSLALKVHWAFNVAHTIRSTVVVSDGNTLLFSSKNGILYLLSTNVDPPFNPDNQPQTARTIDLGGDINAAPAVDKHGLVIVPVGHYLSGVSFASDPPQEVWKYDAGAPILSSPVIWEASGKIYVSSRDGTIHIVNPDGSPSCIYRTGERINRASPAIGSDGTLFQPTEDSLVALSSECHLVWKKSTRVLGYRDSDSSMSNALIGDDETIYVISTQEPTIGAPKTWLFAFNPGDGKQKMLTDPSDAFPWLIGPGQATTSPALNMAGDTLYVTVGNALFVVSLESKVVTKLAEIVDDTIVSSPVVDANNKIYVATDSGKVIVFDANGVQVSRYSTGTASMTNVDPAIGKDGTIYIGNDAKQLLALVQNTAPTGVTCVPRNVPENLLASDFVCELKTISPVEDTYVYTPLEPFDPFEVRADAKLYLKTANALDLDVSNPKTSYTYKIRTASKDNSFLHFDGQITIQVSPVNEFPPHCDGTTTVEIPENLNLNSLVTTVQFVDTDKFDSHSFTLASDSCGLFSISSGSNQLRVASAIDYETLPANPCQAKVHVNNPGQPSCEKNISITVKNVNEPPVAHDDRYVMNEDSYLHQDAPGVLANDTDPEKEPLRAEAINPPPGFTLETTGAFSYRPPENFSGQVTIGYKAIDPGGLSANGSIHITIDAAGDVPTISVTPLQVNEGQQGVALTKANLDGTDPDGDTITYRITTLPTHGRWTKVDGTPLGVGSPFTQQDVNNGSILYHHDHSEPLSYPGDTCTLSVSDGHSFTPIKLDIVVTALNDQPVLTFKQNDLQQRILEDRTTPLIYFTVSDEETPVANLTPRCTYSTDSSLIPVDEEHCIIRGVGTQRSLQIKPVAQKSGISTVSVCVQDMPHNVCQNIHIEVLSVADKPGIEGTLQTNEGQSTIVRVRPNAADGPEVTHFYISHIQHGSVSKNNGTHDAITNGTFITVADGKTGVVFMPADTEPPVSGAFTVQAATCDQTDCLGNEYADVQISVTAINDPPEMTVLQSPVTLREHGTFVFTDNILKTKDIDTPDSDLTYTVIEAPQHGTFYKNGGILDRNVATFTQQDVTNRAIRYAHDGSETLEDRFLFAVSDGTTTLPPQTFHFTIEAVNDAPVPHVSPLVVDEGATASITDNELDTTDPDSPDLKALVYTLYTLPEHGTLKLNGLPMKRDSTFTQEDIARRRVDYTHLQKEKLQDSFVFQVCDTAPISPTCIGPLVFPINTTPVNDPPVFKHSHGLTVDEGAEKIILNGTLLVEDSDNLPSEITYTLVQIPSSGIVYGGGKALNQGDTWTQADIDNGRISYAHNGNPVTSDSFMVKVTDKDGLEIVNNPVRFNIQINPVNDAPTFPGLADIVMNEDEVYDRVIQVQDEETPSNLLTLTVQSNHPELITDDNIRVIQTEHNRTVRITPLQNLFGKARLTLCAQDTNNPPAQTCRDVEVTIRAVADEPTVPTGRTREDEMMVKGMVIQKHPLDGKEVGFFKIHSFAHGSVYLHNETPIADGACISEAQGNWGLKFKPEPKNSVTTGSFVVQASPDSTCRTNLSKEVLATVEVIPVNDPPELVTPPPYAIRLKLDQRLVPLTSEHLRAIDPDHDTKDVRFKIVRSPEYGHLMLHNEPLPEGKYITQNDIENREVQYRVLATGEFNDSFTFEVCDPEEACTDIRTFSIETWKRIQAGHDQAFCGFKGTVTTLKNGSTSLVANDTHPYGGTLDVVPVQNMPTEHGRVTINADGTFAYTHNGDAVLEDSFQYEVCDKNTPEVGCATATVHVGIESGKLVISSPQIRLNQKVRIMADINNNGTEDQPVPNQTLASIASVPTDSALSTHQAMGMQATLALTPTQEQTPTTTLTQDCPISSTVFVDVPAMNTRYCLYDNGDKSLGDTVKDDQIFSRDIDFTLPQKGVRIMLFSSGSQSYALDEKVVDIVTEVPQTIFLTDMDRLHEEFLDTGMSKVGEDQNACANHIHDFVDFTDYLFELAKNRHGMIIDVAKNALTGVAGCNDSYANYGNTLEGRHCKNLLTDQLITTFAKQGITKHVVIVGNDEVIPFYRITDPTDNYNGPGTSIERSYRGESTHPIIKDMHEGYILSDVPFGMTAFQNIALGYDWSQKPQNGEEKRWRKPQPDIAVGRLFDYTPCDLKTSMERLSQPLSLQENQDKAQMFVGTDDPNDRFLNMPVLAQNTFGRNLGSWFGTNYTRHEPRTWAKEKLKNAFNDSIIMIFVGHSEHDYLYRDHNEDEKKGKIAGYDVRDIQLSPSRQSIWVGLACHTGLSLNDETNDGNINASDTVRNTIVNNTIGNAHGVMAFLPTTYAYSRGQMFADVDLHQRMASLFVNKLLDNTTTSIGDAWQRTYHAVATIVPPNSTGDTENNADVFAIKAAYGMALYGLPFQKIQRDDLCNNVNDSTRPSLSSMQSVVSDTGGASLAATPVGKTSLQSPYTFTVTLNNEFVATPDGQGKTLYTVRGGTIVGPPNGEMVPMVVSSHILTSGITLDDISVSIVESQTHVVTQTILPTAPVVAVSGGAVPGNYKIPAKYPADIYQVDVAPYIESSLLSLSVIPLHYLKQEQRVVLYDKITFEVTVTKNAGGQTLLTTTATGAPSKQSQPGDKIKDDAIMFNPQTDEVTVQLPTDKHGPAVLSLAAIDGGNRTLHSQRMLVQLDTYSSTHKMTIPVDDAGWPSRDQMSLHVFLRTCDDTPVVPPEIERDVLPDPNNPDTCRKELFRIIDNNPNRTHRYVGSTSVATWTVTLTDGCGNPINDPNDFSVDIKGDGHLVQPDRYDIVPLGEGTYAISLPLENLNWGTGVHDVTIEATYQNKKSEFYTTIEYSGWIRIIVTGTPSTTIQNTRGIVIDWPLNVVGILQGVENEQPISGLSETNFTFTVDGEEVSPLSFAPAPYSATLQVDPKKKGTNVRVSCVVKVGNISSNPLSENVSIPTDPREPPQPRELVNISYLPFIQRQ